MGLFKHEIENNMRFLASFLDNNLLCPLLTASNGFAKRFVLRTIFWCESVVKDYADGTF